jgi:hypothetical protein
MKITNQNCTHAKIKIRLNFQNSCHNSVQNHPSTSSLKMQMKMYKAIMILPVVLYESKKVFHTEEHIESDGNRVLRSEPKMK